MWRFILSIIGFGPVTKPSRIPELRILENESNLNWGMITIRLQLKNDYFTACNWRMLTPRLLKNDYPPLELRIDYSPPAWRVIILRLLFLPLFIIFLWMWNFSMTLSVLRPVGWLVGRLMVGLFGRSVCHNFLSGLEVSLPCSYLSTCSLDK